MSIYVVRSFARMRNELASGADNLKRRAAIDRNLLVHDVVLRDIYRKFCPSSCRLTDPNARSAFM